MFTQDGLLEIAEDAEIEAKRLFAEFPPGTYSKERNDARKRAEDALTCAVWMENKGHDALDFVGPFGDVKVQRSQKVRVKKGAVIFSTAPQHPREGIVSKMVRTVTIVDIYPGYVANNYNVARSHSDSVVQPRLHWAGAGGYWCWTDFNNVEQA